MGICKRSVLDLSAWLPGNILSLGWPDGIDQYDLSASQLDCVDIIAHTGEEIIADLNFPQKFRQYDLVLDPGTIEHCFNIAQALMNAAHAVKVGGRIIHNSPVSMVNHGYWNVCPVVFKDFYEANGFQIERIELYNCDGSRICQDHDIDICARTQMPSEVCVMVVARRDKDKNAFEFPRQYQYR